MNEYNKETLNAIYQQHRTCTIEIVEAARKITKKHTQELESCIAEVIVACREDGALKLTYDDLEKLAIKIPALCLYLQTMVNDYSLKSEIETLMIDAQVIETLETLRGEKGDSREKMKRAEASQLSDRIVEALNRQVANNIKEIIIRADKVYEGVKKLIDARSRKNEYNRKSQKINT